MNKGAENMKKAHISRLSALLSLTAVLLFLQGCGSRSNTEGRSARDGEPQLVGTQVSTEYGTYTNLKPVELKPMLDQKDFFLVDVHTPSEGRLPQTDARIPFDQVEQQIKEFPADKSAKIVLACRSGRMSSEASQTLLELGYTNVYNLAGGMEAWNAAGYEIVPESK